MSSEDDDKERLELAREKRRRRHLERLGFPDPKCPICGEDDLRCLQLDHIAGKEFSDIQAVICANHHLKRSDLQGEHPLKMADPADPLEVAGRTMLGMADYHDLLGPVCREIGAMLCAEAAARSPRRKDGGNDDDNSGGADGCPG
jgi:hypothetical protein